MTTLRTSDMVLTPMGLRFAGRTFPCSIGRGGISDTKREGDGATPRGIHGIVGMLYRPDRMARPADWALPIRPGDLWSDDPRHEDYNLMVRAPYPHSHETGVRLGHLPAPAPPRGLSHRRLRRPAPGSSSVDCAAPAARLPPDCRMIYSGYFRCATA